MNELDAFEDWFQSELRRVSEDEHNILLSRKLARPVFLAGYRAAKKVLEDDGLAHELFAVSQLIPGDGIEDAIERIKSVIIESSGLRE